LKLEDISQAIKNNKVRVTKHAFEEAFSDNLSFNEIYTSVGNGEIIEDYPDDKPYQSCLIFGGKYKRGTNS